MIAECVDTQAEECISIMIDFLNSNPYLKPHNHLNTNLTTTQTNYQILKLNSEPNKIGTSKFKSEPNPMSSLQSDSKLKSIQNIRIWSKCHYLFINSFSLHPTSKAPSLNLCTFLTTWHELMLYWTLICYGKTLERMYRIQIESHMSLR